MCTTLLEAASSPPEKKDTAAAAAAVQQDNNSVTPRHRRPRQNHHEVQCHQRSSPPAVATAREQHQQQHHQVHDGSTSSAAAVEVGGSSSLGSLSLVVGSCSAARALEQQQCSKCCARGGSGLNSIAGRTEDECSSDLWIEKAVAAGKAAWGGLLGRGLLRHRKRSGSLNSPWSQASTTMVSPTIASCRDGVICRGSLPSLIPQLELSHSENTNVGGCSGSGSCGGGSICRKRRQPCWLRGSPGGDGCRGGGGGCGPSDRGGGVPFVVVMVLTMLFMAWALWLAVCEIHIRSYCMQVRLMESTRRLRGECPIVKLTRESSGGWDALSALPPAGVSKAADGGGSSTTNVAGAVVAGGEEEGRLRFCIILLSDDGMWPREYSEKSVANKKAYAALHGYDVVVATAAEIDRSRPAGWSKLLVLKKHLDHYDYVMFVDIDAFIMNPAFKLEWIVDVAKKQLQIGGMDGWGGGTEADLIVTQDYNGPNSGVILMKNSRFSRWLLQEWWDQDQFVDGNYPFHYEQRAMHYLLQTDTWRKAGLPLYADFAVVREHTAVVDQCTMNSYVVHPWQVLRGRTVGAGSYEPGDFMLHFAGRKGRVRLNLVDHYYPMAEKAVEELAASLNNLQVSAVADTRAGVLERSPQKGGGGSLRGSD